MIFEKYTQHNKRYGLFYTVSLVINTKKGTTNHLRDFFIICRIDVNKDIVKMFAVLGIEKGIKTKQTEQKH